MFDQSAHDQCIERRINEAMNIQVEMVLEGFLYFKLKKKDRQILPHESGFLTTVHLVSVNHNKYP